ncbi:LysR family transcriptional regulator [Methylotenera versatilis]|jgi:DNA-binding transcriptional LysR family regulator|uniref:Transcriptional regulator, LysR family n=1 Tax=Methylotenera versatilis (strain 301) TaxID=666681 RepID=D7DQ38_METV0|nr:LysR family transcriptional regulator [Methylotenera versatilis]ADI29409.1 transcriptional regulator, LysR family [Methylotenera versatilis 301]
MKYSLRQLEIFVAICRTESVSRASEALSLSQSATSTALSELERQFDLQLFDRGGKSLRINETGQQLLPRAVELLDRAKEIENLLQGHAGFGHMRIGATLTVGNYLATILVARFLQEHSESRIQLKVHNTSTIVQQIANHELDLGMIEGDCNHPDIEVQPWIADELVVFSAPNHPLASQRKVSLEQLLQEDWILREKGSGTRATFDRAFHSYHSQLKIRLELEHTEAIKRAVESGLGIGCISRLALKDAFRRGSLVPISTPSLNLSRFFYFLWHKQKYQTTGIREFLDLCRRLTEGVERSDLVNLPEIA